MPAFQLTPAQLALQAERKALRESKKAAAKAQAGSQAVGVQSAGDVPDDRSKILKREWVRLNRNGDGIASSSVLERTTRIVTWNVCPLISLPFRRMHYRMDA